MSVSSSALKIGIIFDILSFFGEAPRETDVLRMSERTAGDMTSLEYLRS